MSESMFSVAITNKGEIRGLIVNRDIKSGDFVDCTSKVIITADAVLADVGKCDAEITIHCLPIKIIDEEAREK